MDKLKNILRNLNFENKSKRIEIEAYTLEKAINEGCKKLRASIDEVEYEVIQYGKKGFLGISKVPYKILIYKVVKKEEISDITSSIDEEVNNIQEVIDPDGKCFVLRSRRGVLLKVTSPKNKEGHKVKLKEVNNLLNNAEIEDFNPKTVKTIVSKAEGKYIKIADYNGIDEASAEIKVRITSDEMKAFITVSPPKSRGYDPTYEDIIGVLEDNGVVKGYDEKEIDKLIDEMIYYQDVQVAQGEKAKNGDNAKLEYFFDLGAEKKVYQDMISNGKFEFKNITSNIQNVIKNDLLIEKKPPTKGEPGYTVTGKLLPAKSGNDRQIQKGEGTVLSKDGMQLRAEIDGQVIKKRGRICVEPVKHVQGNVDIKVGNIVFVGSVIVHGSVLDNFSIKAKGKIEVRGSVGKCSLISDSDIYVAQGIIGKQEAEIISEGSVFAKFIENAKVSTKDSLVIDDHIMHSRVDAVNNVIVFGRRAQITGGVCRVGLEVNTKKLGAVSYPDTIVEFGIPPELRMEFDEVQMELKNTKKAIEDNKRSITTLEMQKKKKKNWNDEKEQKLENLINAVPEMEQMIQNLQERNEELEHEIEESKLDGRVCAETKVFPNVVIRSKKDEYKVESEIKAVSFFEKQGEITAGPYESPNIDKRMYDKRMLSLRGKL